MTLLLQNYHFSQHSTEPQWHYKSNFVSDHFGSGLPQWGRSTEKWSMPISHKMFFTKPPQKFDQMTSIILTIIRHRTLKQWRFAALWKISSIELDFVGLIITYSVVIVGGIQLGRGGCSWSRPRSPTWFMRPPIHTNNLNCPPRQYSRTSGSNMCHCTQEHWQQIWHPYMRSLR